MFKTLRNEQLPVFSHCEIWEFGSVKDYVASAVPCGIILSRTSLYSLSELNGIGCLISRIELQDAKWMVHRLIAKSRFYCVTLASASKSLW